MPALTSDDDDDVPSNCENIIDLNCRAVDIIISCYGCYHGAGH